MTVTGKAPAGLTARQARVLAAVTDKAGGEMSTTIARAAGYGQGLTRGILAALDRKGFVIRGFHAAGCYTWWRLTDAGRQVLAEAPSHDR